MPPTAKRQDQGQSGYRIGEMTLSDDQVITAKVNIPSDSPWFAGHFPGNPILPGIALMKIVSDLMQQAIGPGLKLEEFKRVRFKQLIRPDTVMSVMITPPAKKRGFFGYSLSVEGEMACSGLIRIRHDDTAVTGE